MFTMIPKVVKSGLCIFVTVCQCDYRGVSSSYFGCNPVCGCKRNVIGQNCDQCAPQHFGLSESDPAGCQPCDCDLGGATDNECDVITGQCKCKPGSDTGRRCDVMIVGTLLPKESLSSKLMVLPVLLAWFKSLI